jgi:hypothetical protein
MEKDMQKRLMVVAALLERVADSQEKLALDGADDKRTLWNKIFGPKGEGAEQAPSKVTPQETLKSLDERAEKEENRVLFKKKEAPAPAPTRMPKPVQDKLPSSKQDLQDFAAFLQGKGPVPLELANSFKQVSHALASIGAISLKDADNVVMFLSKMIRSYLAGQKLANARKERLAVKKEAKPYNKSKVRNLKGSYYELESGDIEEVSDMAAWAKKSGTVSGLFRGYVTLKGVEFVLFRSVEGKLYAVPSLEAEVEDSEPFTKKASYTEQLDAILGKSK